MPIAAITPFFQLYPGDHQETDRPVVSPETFVFEAFLNHLKLEEYLLASTNSGRGDSVLEIRTSSFVLQTSSRVLPVPSPIEYTTSRLSPPFSFFSGSIPSNPPFKSSSPFTIISRNIELLSPIPPAKTTASTHPLPPFNFNQYEPKNPKILSRNKLMARTDSEVAGPVARISEKSDVPVSALKPCATC